MLTATKRQSIPQSTLWQIAGLLAISAALLVIGIAVERSGERLQSSTLPQAAVSTPIANPGGEGHDESSEGHVDAQPTGQGEPIHNETAFGIDLENPWLIGLAVVGSLLLTAALWRFGYAVLPVIVLFAAAAALFDAGELLRQVQNRNTTVGLFATVVLLAHIAVIVLSVIALYKNRSRQVSAASS